MQIKISHHILFQTSFKIDPYLCVHLSIYLPLRGGGSSIGDSVPPPHCLAHVLRSGSVSSRLCSPPSTLCGLLGVLPPPPVYTALGCSPFSLVGGVSNYLSIYIFISQNRSRFVFCIPHLAWQHLFHPVTMKSSPASFRRAFTVYISQFSPLCCCLGWIVLVRDCHRACCQQSRGVC